MTAAFGVTISNHCLVTQRVRQRQQRQNTSKQITPSIRQSSVTRKVEPKKRIVVLPHWPAVVVGLPILLYLPLLSTRTCNKKMTFQSVYHVHQTDENCPQTRLHVPLASSSYQQRRLPRAIDQYMSAESGGRSYQSLDSHSRSHNDRSVSFHQHSRLPPRFLPMSPFRRLHQLPMTQSLHCEDGNEN